MLPEDAVRDCPGIRGGSMSHKIAAEITGVHSVNFEPCGRSGKLDGGPTRLN